MVDSFFVNPSKTRKRRAGERGAPPNASRSAKSGSGSRPSGSGSRTSKKPQADEDLSEGDVDSEISSGEESGSAISSDSDSDHETAADKRRRLAREYLSTLEKDAINERPQTEGDEIVDHEFDAADLDREIVGRRLREDVNEEEDKIFRRVAEGETPKITRVRRVRTRAKYPTGVASVGNYSFTVSKDMTLQKWQLPSAGKEGDEQIKSLKTVLAGNKSGALTHGHSDEILCVACSADGQYVATGGRDRRICVWSGNTLALLHVFEVRDRKAEVYGLCFRRLKGSPALYAACGDLRVRTFDVVQKASVEQLYGHQDSAVGIAALGAEKCVTVGSRDRSAIMWKIPEESRLTLRSGDTKALAQHGTERDLTLEGSLDCVAMLDGQHFVTGSDNGLVQLWTGARKKPLCVQREAHGKHKQLKLKQHTGEQNLRSRQSELPPALPRAITAIAAVPMGDLFVSGSENGTVRVWQLDSQNRSFQLVKELVVGRGIVTGLSVCERARRQFTVLATLSREPRLGRFVKISGHDTVSCFGLEL